MGTSAIFSELPSFKGHIGRLANSFLYSRAAERQSVRPATQRREERTAGDDPLSRTAQDAATVSNQQVQSYGQRSHPAG